MFSEVNVLGPHGGILGAVTEEVPSGAGRLFRCHLAFTVFRQHVYPDRWLRGSHSDAARLGKEARGWRPAENPKPASENSNSHSNSLGFFFFFMLTFLNKQVHPSVFQFFISYSKSLFHFNKTKMVEC